MDPPSKDILISGGGFFLMGRAVVPYSGFIISLVCTCLIYDVLSAMDTWSSALRYYEPPKHGGCVKFEG